MYQSPVDDRGIRVVGCDAEEPAQKKGRCANAPEDRQHTDQPQEFEGFHVKSRDNVPSGKFCSFRAKKCSLKADASLAAAELLGVDVFRHQEIAVGKSGRTEGIEQQLTHIPRRQG